MTKEEIVSLMESADGIWGTMFGKDVVRHFSPLTGKGYFEKDDYVFISKDELKEWGTKECTGYFFIWGMPGPDYNVYLFSDYGKTWSFDENDLIKGGHKKYECHKP